MVHAYFKIHTILQIKYIACIYGNGKLFFSGKNVVCNSRESIDDYFFSHKKMFSLNRPTTFLFRNCQSNFKRVGCLTIH